MRIRICKCIVTCAALVTVPSWLTAQNPAEQETKQVRYKVISLGTLGGSFAEGNGISNKDWVAGFSTLPGDQAYHATLWTKERGLQDLGTLGGANSSMSFPVKDARGLLVGVADISTIDPFNEGLCGGQAAPFTISDPYICRGFMWKKGVMTPLPTLGGNNSFAENVNDRGQIVGIAETANPDPNCIAPQVFDFEAVIWGPPQDQIQELPLLPGDVVAFATGINDKGQVAGAAGPVCASPPVALYTSSHIVLWENGTVTNLGSLGGVAGNLPFAINNRGDIVGQSDVAGDTANQAFLWTKEKGMQALGTLPDYNASGVAFGINNKGQIVGGLNDASGSGPAVLWQNGLATDLNTLICGGSSLYLGFAGDINDDGEIAGQAIDINTGAMVGFLAIPVQGGDDCQANPIAGQRVVLPEAVREQLRQHSNHGRFGRGLIRPQQFVGATGNR